MVEIREVINGRERKLFADFPNKFYRNVEQFVPGFLSDDISDWDPDKNPATEYCEFKAFLAYKDGKLVGRIGAILSHKSNEKWNYNRMRFSCVDFIDDYEVSEALFGTVEKYAREKGCDAVHGPLGFSDLDREGMLVEGFDYKSMFITYYNHPYYIDHLTRLGYVKDVDWIEYLIDVPSKENIARIARLSELVLKRFKLHKAEITSVKQYPQYIEKIFRLVNIAYADLYGTVDLTDEQIKRYAKKFAPLVNPKLMCVVEDEEGEVVAFGVTAPSVADALKKSNGRLFPFGFIGILKAFHKNDTIDLFLTAVHPKLRGRGINAVLISHVWDGCSDLGIVRAESGPQLEENSKILAQWNGFDKIQHKRRRCFVKDLKN
ncbi:MAG: GNAT family N-acetyltransferase [Ruminococcaceae bacterium]|nr:GNAT family N-acetyltransferase [Oscillospiraceae bacterium]